MAGKVPDRTGDPPATRSGALAHYPAPAPAGEQHDQRHARTQPNSALHCEFHLFLLSETSPPGYRVFLRERRRLRKSIMMPPAVIQIAACIIVSFILFALLCVSSYLLHHRE